MKKLLLISLLSTFGLADTKIPMEPNKIYVLDFFASWCSSCEKEIPILSKLNQKFQKENIELIGIDVDKKLEDAQKFQTKMAKYINYKVINDTSNDIISSYKPIGMPALYIIKNNQVCGKIFGAVSNLEEKLDEQIKVCEEKK